MMPIRIINFCFSTLEALCRIGPYTENVRSPIPIVGMLSVIRQLQRRDNANKDTAIQSTIEGKDYDSFRYATMNALTETGGVVPYEKGFKTIKVCSTFNNKWLALKTPTPTDSYVREE